MSNQPSFFCIALGEGAQDELASVGLCGEDRGWLFLFYAEEIYKNYVNETSLFQGVEPPRAKALSSQEWLRLAQMLSKPAQSSRKRGRR